MAPTPREILDLALAQLPSEAKSAAGELGRRIGLPYQQVYKWVTGANDPSATGVLLIAEQFGWLNLDAAKPTEPQAADPDRPPTTEDLAAKMEEGLANQRGLADTLEQLLGAVSAVSDSVGRQSRAIQSARREIRELRSRLERPDSGQQPTAQDG